MGLLGSIGKTLFGSGSSKTKSTSTNIYTADQTKLLNNIAGDANKGYGAPTTKYPGQSYVPLSAMEQQYLDAAQLSPDQMSARESALQSVLSGQPSYTADPALREQYYNEAVFKPAWSEYTDTILPQTMEAAAGSGFHSSDTLDRMGQAAGDLETQLAAKRAEMVYNDVIASRAAMESAASRKANLVMSPDNIVSGAATQMGTAGAYARSVAQEKVASDLQRWLSGEEMQGSWVNAYNPNTALALAVLGLSPYALGQKTTTSGAGLFNGLLSGVGSGIGQGIGQGIGK